MASVDERDTDRDLIGRFLLGGASEEERQQVEERLFADDAFLADVQDREDELVDDYAHGRLDRNARPSFEQRLLSSARGRERLAFARAAARLAPAPAAARPWTPAWLPTAAAAVFAMVAAALGVRTLHEAREGAEMSARFGAREQELLSAVETERARAQPLPALSPPIALVLGSGGTREGGDAPQLAVPKDVPAVGIAVPVASRPAYASYQAVLRTPEGALVWEAAGLHPQPAQRLVLDIPTDVLGRGDYILTLSGRGRMGPAVELADHYFRVVR